MRSVKLKNIDHRLTKPHTPKTNGMVERANGIIKSNTILTEQYATKEEMNTHLMKFLVYYLLYRRRGSLKKEIGVKTHLLRQFKNGTICLFL